MRDFPRPIIYSFNPAGLVCFVLAEDFDREHGQHASNNLLGVIKRDSLVYAENGAPRILVAEECFVDSNQHAPNLVSCNW
jgi:hypothetical protein